MKVKSCGTHCFDSTERQIDLKKRYIVRYKEHSQEVTTIYLFIYTATTTSLFLPWEYMTT